MTAAETQTNLGALAKEVAGATSLKGLLVALRAHDEALGHAQNEWPTKGWPEIDMSSLPTFGGEEPKSTSGVWSWDERSVMVGTCVDDMAIVDREEVQ